MLIDIPDRLAHVLTHRALALNLPVDAVAAAAIAGSLGAASTQNRYHLPVWERIGDLVNKGLTDADIAAATHYTVGYVSTIRRRLELPPNPRRTPRAREPRHGTKATYDRHKCRCDECRAANTTYQRERRQKRRAANDD